MIKVAELVLGEDHDVRPPEIVPAVARPLALGTDKQVQIRSLAEQLVCEANAILAQTSAGEQLLLADRVADGVLSFEISYRGRCAQVETRFADGAALGRLAGDGFASATPHELAGIEELERLLLTLLDDQATPAEPIPS